SAGAGRERHVFEAARKGGPILLAHLARTELVVGGARDLAKTFRVEIVQRHTDDAAAGTEAGAREGQQTGQELASGEIAGRAHEHDDLCEPGPNARRNLCHVATPLTPKRRGARITRKS